MTPFEKWQATIQQSKSDPHWNDYDATIVAIVNEFNTRLAATRTGYPGLDWHLIKAMVWTESGGPTTAAWTSRPIQIGNPGDPGLASLLSGKEGGDLILSNDLKVALKASTSTPELNIKAGIGYLLMRAATFAYKSINDPTDSKIYEAVVKPGDSIDKIAKQNHTTTETIKAMNPTALVMIKPGQKLRYQKASIQQVITAWQTIDPQFAAVRYNSGDPLYRQKLEFCLSVMGK